LRSDEKVAQDAGESRNQVQRYIRLTELHPELLQLVDSGRIKFNPAVYLSYLWEEEQAALLEAIQSEDATPSVAQAIKMKQFSDDGKLTLEVIHSIMLEEKPNQVVQFKIPKAKIIQFFAPETTAKDMEAIVIKALEQYRQREKRREGAGVVTCVCGRPSRTHCQALL